MAIIDESIVNDDKCSYKSLLEESKMGKDKESVNLGVNEESERVILILERFIWQGVEKYSTKLKRKVVKYE